MLYGLSNCTIYDDLERPCRHSPIACFFKCEFLNIYAAIDGASRGPCAVAELLVIVSSFLCIFYVSLVHCLDLLDFNVLCFFSTKPIDWLGRTSLK